MHTRRIGWGSTLLACLLSVLLGATAMAQTPLGRITGTVMDESGGVLPGVTVTLTNVGTNQIDLAVTNETGTFTFPQVPVGTYRINVALEGFRSVDFTNVIVTVGQEYSLTAKLEIGAITEVVTVTAGVSIVSTTTPEVSSTVLQSQVLNIPLLNRDVTNLIKLQAGVAGVNATQRGNTAINGGRPSWTQVTLDGISIQDNYIRTNSLDFLPNRPTSDNVAEFSMVSSVQGADSAGGASSIRMVTPSGTNTLRGSVYEFNRDARFAANSFFNNAADPKVPKAELSRHQFGGRVGGPLQYDRMFFFVNYEGFRQTTQTAQNLVIPANADFADGVFRYVDLAGNVQSVNVLQLSGLAPDPLVRSQLVGKLPDPSKINNYTVGNSRADRILNTAGYRFNQSDLNDRNQFTGRLDYTATSAHRFEGVFSYFKEIDDRTDLDFVSTDRPLVYTSSDPKRFALAWRWIKSASFQNELRGGANLAPVQFATDWDYGGGVLFNTALGLSNPMGGYSTNGATPGFQAQGRYTDTYQISNNASYLRGDHSFQLGGNWQRNRVNPYNFAGQYPTVTFGFSSAAPAAVQLNSAMFPGGISAAELANANAMASFLGGVVSSVSQTYQIKDKTSGFVPGIPANEFYTLDNIALFVQDNWRWKPNFTVRGGLKWEYYSPLREDNDLGFVPQLNGRTFQQAMLDPTTTVSFVNGDYYKKDLNNFGPTVGFAWDVTRDGRTAVRGGYSLTFVNEETVTVGRAVGRSNAGLSTAVTLSNQYAFANAGVPLPATPTFLSERTLENQMALSTTGILWGIDNNIKTPYVHQVSVGLQRELPWSFAGEVRYVGTFGRDIWRGIDYNQIEISQAFFDDFLRARNNGFLSVAAGGAFDPTYAGPGSQPLSVLNQPQFGLLTNATLRTHLQQNAVGSLADFYMTSLGTAALRAQARQYFYPNGNPGAYSSNAIINGGFTDYNALQLELRRQFRHGLFFQANYTFADTTTDSEGTGQNRFEAFMDNRRPELQYSRGNFHITHVMNANAIYELPFGSSKRWLNSGGITEMLAGGWQVGTIVALQSGAPLTIFSGRGTFNRAGRSNCGTTSVCNTAVSSLSVKEIQNLMGIYKMPDGRIFWIDPKVVDPNTGRAVGADTLGNTKGFDGQIFFNPAAGEVGNLPVMAFDGPKVFRLDMSLSKRTRILDRYALELKGEAFNLTNSVSFYRGDMDINSTTFGRVTSVIVPSRVIQLSARFDF